MVVDVPRPRGRRAPFGRRFGLPSRVLTWALAAIIVVGIASSFGHAQGIVAGEAPLPSLIGKTAEEVRAQWGSPRYIKVAPHDGDRRYAYFTLREWEQLGRFYPATQGEDVYVAQELKLQVHLRYQAVFDSENRFSPEFRVATVTYVFDEPTPLARAVQVLPVEGLALDEARWYWHGAPGAARTLLVHWPDYRFPGSEALTPFRADPGITFQWEIGLSVPMAAVDGQAPVNYIIAQLAQFLYDPRDLEEIPAPSL